MTPLYVKLLDFQKEALNEIVDIFSNQSFDPVQKELEISLVLSKLVKKTLSAALGR